MKTNFHNKNFALRLALKMRQGRTRKWSMASIRQEPVEVSGEGRKEEATSKCGRFRFCPKIPCPLLKNGLLVAEGLANSDIKVVCMIRRLSSFFVNSYKDFRCPLDSSNPLAKVEIFCRWVIT